MRKDPGVWIVYLGCLLLSVGLYMAFFMSHRRMWATLKPDKSGTKISVAAAASKSRVSFEEKIDRMLKGLVQPSGGDRRR